MKILLLVLLCCSSLLNAQEVRDIHIKERINSTKLSQIADEVIPIILNRRVGGIQFIYLTDRYIFICGTSSVISQFDISGNFIRNIDCGDYIVGMTGDTLKKEIYVAKSGKEIKCYDYSLHEKRTYKLENEPISVFCYKNNIWVQSYKVENEKIDYKMSKVNLFTCKETLNSFDFSGHIIQNSKNGAVSLSTFSVYNNLLVFALSMDSVVYKVENERILPFIRWKIKSKEQSCYVKQFVLSTKGIVGNYFYINYVMRNPSDVYSKNEHYFYLENLKTGSKYNINMRVNKEDASIGGIYDDFYQTGYINLIQSCNQAGSFYFVKGEDVVRKRTSKIKTKGGSVIFVVKNKN